MSILVTGGAGYIGSHTVIELINSGYDVVIVDDFSNSKPTVLDRIEKIAGKRPTFYEANILDGDALRQIFEKESIDAVIHYAAFKAVGESVEKPIDYYHNNMGGLLQVLKVMKEFGVKEFVYSSSATVYGMNNVSPLTEDLPTSATNPYGYSKVMGEQILKDTYKAHPDWSIMILRYFNPIGAHESGLIGEDPQGVPNNIMPYITQVAIGKLEKLHVFGNDYDTHDGTGVRDYLHVVDLAKGHVAAIDYANKHQGLEIVNLGTGQGYSVLDLVNTFQEVNHVDLPYVIDERRAGDVAECYADPSYAKELLGWEAEEDLADMCRDSWHWQETCPNGYED
ncbi:UDP-glucose 4-epimerase GalE [Aerococcus urinae]|uniref:UDP-glucose 4-epimerase n=1 Tax=Aerococcus urinae TaxID=1376 RepID=A0A0X8FF67_9LACT|nr:UDP-glucose 4-epimerase GalE [Aerococcus urinae]AMB96194.1 UDP-glucose 4-epimerase [Aerococcus urinae]MCY3033379.1 UDP-glucose 4-epimerase GalE [Aerococcus urinae]MCY3038571.1 UDP-glucose 4-epimerase GalE [Aerococcus urinae]MCY3045441.1 UDP-glucose 4-epimerase GalE [Aerococcus urinae]MCY3048880.1 UDP-glucose 4-epimerase GalE [Aerococcus urinae]